MDVKVFTTYLSPPNARECVDDFDSDLWRVTVRPTYWPAAELPEHAMTIVVVALQMFASGFLNEPGKMLFDWLKSRVFPEWKELSGTTLEAPFELEVRTKDLQIILKTRDLILAEKALASLREAVGRKRSGQALSLDSLVFDDENPNWVLKEPLNTHSLSMGMDIDTGDSIRRG